MEFQPDYRQIEKVLHNLRPERLPLYNFVLIRVY